MPPRRCQLRRVDALVQAGDDMHGNLSQRFRQAHRALVDPLRLRVGRVVDRMRQVLRADAAVDLGDGRALVRVGDHQPAPVLCVAGCRRLHRQLDALQNHLAADRPGQVQTLANRPRGAQQFIDGG